MLVVINHIFIEAVWVHLYSCPYEKSLPVCSLYFRAIYFAAYSKAKEIFNGLFVPNSGAVHMSSAGLAGEQSAC